MYENDEIIAIEIYVIKYEKKKQKNRLLQSFRYYPHQSSPL